MGEQIGIDAATLLRSVIDKMVEQPEEPTAEISIEDIPLALLMKQLDLMAKAG
jgi:hypothetical protein